MRLADRARPDLMIALSIANEKTLGIFEDFLEFARITAHFKRYLEARHPNVLLVSREQLDRDVDFFIIPLWQHSICFQ